MHAHRPAFVLLALAMGGCGDGVGTGDAAVAPQREAPASITLGETAATEYMAPGLPARTGAAPQGRWFVQGDDTEPHAVWGAPHSEGTLSLGCDATAGRIVVQREAIGVPATISSVTLEADGILVDYPAEYAESTLGAHLTTRVALDAPILDRMLTASRFAVHANGSAIATTSPSAALQPVVDACRARH